MRKLAVCLALFALIPALTVSARAQQAAPSAQSTGHAETAEPLAHFYRLDFMLAERDAAGKPLNSRSFSTTVGTAGTRSGSLTVGSKIPVVTAKDGPDKSTTEFQYIDIGVKMNVSDVHENENHLAFNLHAEVSSLAAPTVLSGIPEPAFRQNVWSGDVLVPVGKPAAIFKSDSLDNKGSMELEVTATPVE